MAHIRGFVSFVVILFCTDLFCSAEEDSQEQISVPESEHFCTKVMSGRFEHIQLVNIDQLNLYEPDNRMLTCQVVPKKTNDSDKIEYEYVNEENSLTLNDTYGEWGNNNAFRIDRWLQALFQKQRKNIFRSLYESKLVKPEDLKLDRKVYYFMEKTENPHEIRLVHRDHAGANGSSADRQLLGGGQLPNGFEYDGSLYLFDGSLGCVYVIQHFEFNLTQQFEEGKVDIRLARLNIPYEQYFKCPDKYKLANDFAQPYRADRCDSVIGGDDGSIDRGAQNHQHIDQNMSTGLFWTLIGLACLLLMTIIVVGMVIFWQKIKPSKIGNKKRPIGPNDLESANKSNKTLTTSGTTEASVTTTTAVSSSADATVQSGTAK